jgi:hypothetical protein
MIAAKLAQCPENRDWVEGEDIQDASERGSETNQPLQLLPISDRLEVVRRLEGVHEESPGAWIGMKNE